VGALVGIGALAASALTCRRPEPLRTECLRLDAPRAPVGFDAPFSITATLDCPEARGGRIDWRQVGGPPLRSLTPVGDGFQVTGRLPALRDLLPGPGDLPWGVVPLSQRTRAEVVLRATWSDGRGHTLTRDARVAAAHRSRGLPNTPVGVRIYLGGEGWHVTTRPSGSTAALATGRGFASLLPDIATGSWRTATGGRSPCARAATTRRRWTAGAPAATPRSRTPPPRAR
jgi:hypothetical protein